MRVSPDDEKVSAHTSDGKIGSELLRSLARANLTFNHVSSKLRTFVLLCVMQLIQSRDYLLARSLAGSLPVRVHCSLGD